MYDDPQVRGQVKLAQALEAMRPQMEAAVQYLTEMWNRLMAWAEAFGEVVQQAINAWWEQHRPVIAMLILCSNIAANREAARRRRRKGIWSSTVQLHILKSRLHILRQ